MLNLAIDSFGAEDTWRIVKNLGRNRRYKSLYKKFEQHSPYKRELYNELTAHEEAAGVPL